MKIFFDARYTRTDYHDGISRYSAELGNALLGLTNDITFLISHEKQRRWFPKDAQFLTIHAPTSIKEPLTALFLNKYKPDVVYSPMQTIGTIGRNYRSILTLHDMIYYRHNTAPGFLPTPVRAGWWLYHQAYWPQKLLLKGADILTTVSHTSAREIEKAGMACTAPIIVYNAPQHFTTYPVHHEKVIKNIIYMGSFMAYKNVEVLIKGMEWLPGRTLHLLSKITPGRQAVLTAAIPEGAKVVFHNGVSDDQYEQLLAHNALLATASYDEGFGIPVAEAMRMGVPAVVSDIEIFHEVGGHGVLYFNPNSPREFAKKVKVFDNGSVRDEYIDRAKKHSATFNWEDSASTLLAAINSVASSVTIK